MPRLAADEAYALWAPTYPPHPHNALMRIEQDTLTPLIAAARPVRALDVGTGTGRYLPVLAAAGASVVVGLDLSMAMLTRHDGTRRVQADARALPFADATFNLITASLMAGDIETLDAWVAEMSRALTPGGHLIYSDFHPCWRRQGWRRTFRTAQGRTVELDYHPHEMDAHLDAHAAASLHTRVIREPRAPGARYPVIAAFHAVKAGGRPSFRRR